MQSNEDFRFDISLSKESFVNKTISNAMIGKSSQTNRQIRKEYGFKSSRGVSFDGDLYLTPSLLLEHLLKGHVFCHNFQPYQRRKDGTFGSSQKTKRNFRYTNLIGVDIDTTNYKSVKDYIDRLRLKPTFWYTSYSHLKYDMEKEYGGPRFRMIYVFNSRMDNPYYFRYCASKLNRMIEDDTGEKITDKCNLNCTQYFNGTCIGNSDLYVESGITNFIYDLEDIGVRPIKSSDLDYIDYLCHRCYYSTLKLDDYFGIRNELKRITGKDYKYNSKKRIFEVNQEDKNNTLHTINVELEKDRTLDYDNIFETPNLETPTYSAATNTILYDWDHRKIEDFLKCNKWNKALESTKYVYRLEKEWDDNNYQFVDDDYFSLFHFRSKRFDHQGRRKTLYQRMCMRRLLSPQITKDEMVVNTIIDIIKYFDNSDGVLNSDFIRNNIDTSFSLSLDEINEMYKVSIDYLKAETRPKKGYIVRYGVGDNQRVSYEILDDFYNPSYNVKENYDYLKENYNISFSKSTLYDYCKDRNIMTDKNKLSDDDIMELIDLSLSYRKSYEWFKTNNIKVGDKRLRRLYNKKNEEISISYQGEYPKDKNNSLHTINVVLEKDRTPVSATKVNHNNKIKYQDKPLISPNNVSWGMTERKIDEWDERYEKERKRTGSICGEDMLDDIVNWCNDFLR